MDLHEAEVMREAKAKVYANPRDPVLRLVFADDLEGAGDHEGGRWQRTVSHYLGGAFAGEASVDQGELGVVALAAMELEALGRPATALAPADNGGVRELGLLVQGLRVPLRLYKTAGWHASLGYKKKVVFGVRDALKAAVQLAQGVNAHWEGLVRRDRENREAERRRREERERNDVLRAARDEAVGRCRKAGLTASVSHTLSAPQDALYVRLPESDGFGFLSLAADRVAPGLIEDLLALDKEVAARWKDLLARHGLGVRCT